MYDVDSLLPEIAPVRELLLGGDLRPLYLAWLACSYDDESQEPPVPAGLGELTPALIAMAKLYAVSDDLIAAAAELSPPAPKATDAGKTLEKWVANQSKDNLKELVRRLLASDAAAARAETLSRIRDEAGGQRGRWPNRHGPWPSCTSRPTDFETSGSNANDRPARRRVASGWRPSPTDPCKLIANVEKLGKRKSVRSYEQAARELVDLREALGPERGPAEGPGCRGKAPPREPSASSARCRCGRRLVRLMPVMGEGGNSSFATRRRG